MIYIYGDSHANASFKNLKLVYKNCYENSITMFRIGRDNTIINFKKDEIRNKDDVIVLSYGEVDCRCHIQKQIDNGRKEDDIIHELVRKYCETLRNNIVTNNKIILVGVIPPTKQCDYEAIHGPILHEFPFVGKDADRVRYTNKVNEQLQELAKTHNYIYFNPYSYYTRDDGTLKFELSDTTGHLRDNTYFLEQFYECYRSVCKTDEHVIHP